MSEARHVVVRRHLIWRAVLALVVATALLPAAPAAAHHTPGQSCFPYDRWEDQRDAPPECRATMVLDPGQGQLVDRQLLVANANLYTRRGWSKNFLWYAPQVDDHQVAAGRSWDFCHSNTPHPGAACDQPMDTELPGGDGFPLSSSFRSQTPTVPSFVFGDGFIGRTCGNDSTTGRGATPIPSIEGAKFHDLDADGTWDAGEPPVADWPITIRRTSSLFGDQAPASWSLSTGPDGRYRFDLDGQGPGTYVVEEGTRPGWTPSTPDRLTVVVGAGVGDRTYSAVFGNYQPITLSGVKVEDLDADGVDAGDPRLEGWTIRLLDGDGDEVARTTTDADGAYAFTVDPGDHVVEEVMQAGWVQSAPATGSHAVSVLSGQDTSGLDFGNFRPATIEGRKFHDVGVDGQGDGDAGVPDWPISLDGGDPLLTGTDGGYRFTGLRPGTYTIAEVARDGWRQTAPATGSHTVTVRSGDVATALDFGNVCLGDVAIEVIDVSGGLTDLGVDMRLEEVDVPGILANDPALPRTGTDLGRVDGLLPGTYRLTAFLPDDVFSADPRVQLVDGRFAIVADVDIAPCTTTDVTLQVFTASAGKVTGGMRQPHEGGFATAGFQFQTSPQGEPRGTLEYQDHVSRLNLHTRDIRGIRVDDQGVNAWVWGVLERDGTSQRFVLHLIDAGEPGRSDRFELTLQDGYSAGFDVSEYRGNVQIHPAKP